MVDRSGRNSGSCRLMLQVRVLQARGVEYSLGWEPPGNECLEPPEEPPYTPNCIQRT